MGLTAVEVCLAGASSLIPLGCLLRFTAWVCLGIPAPEVEACACRPPMLMPHYSNRVEWRCGGCGQRWRVEVDLTAPRAEHRQWVVNDPDATGDTRRDRPRPSLAPRFASVPQQALQHPTAGWRLPVRFNDDRPGAPAYAAAPLQPVDVLEHG